MAEAAQREIELVVPAVADLVRNFLLSESDARILLKRFTKFEYKVNGLHTNIDDYLAYVRFIAQLIVLSKKRCTRDQKDNVMKSVRKVFTRKMERVFAAACQNFKHDQRLWITRIECARRYRTVAHVSRLYNSALDVLNADVKFWVAVAKFEFESQNEADSARSVFHKALRRFPDNEEIWIELFRMELLHVETVCVRKCSEDPLRLVDVSELELVRLVLSQAEAAVPNKVHLLARFLEISLMFTFAEGISDDIYAILRTKFATNSKAVDLVCRRPFDICLRDVKAGEFADGEGMKQAILQSLQNFAEASATGDQFLANAYVDFCSEALKIFPNDFSLQALLTSELTDIFCKARMNSLSVKSSLLFSFSATSFSTALHRAVQSLKHVSASDPEFVVLQVAITYLCIDTKNLANDYVFSKLNGALLAVPSVAALPVWELLLKFLCKHQGTRKGKSNESILKLFKKAVLITGLVGISFKRMYLTWTNAITGPHASFRLFEQLVHVKPNSVDLYFDQLRFLKSSVLSRCDKARLMSEVFRFAADECGSYSVELWLKCVDFYKENPHSLTKVYSKALQCLNKEYVEQFKRRVEVKSF